MLSELLHTIDRIQARRFDRLTGTALTIATVGIQRHLEACHRHEVDPDVAAIREIIDDALDGRAVYAETGWQQRREVQRR